QVRAVLESKLPGYMVPSALMVLPALPLMPNGKLDRKALPEPDAELGHEAVAPRDAREAALMLVWKDVLRRDDLGVTENFFEVGGDSILSLQIIARARQVGLKLTPRQVFEHPTVAGLSRVAQDVAGEEVRHTEVHESLGLTPIQAMFFDRFPQGESHWNQSVLLTIRGGLDTTALDTVLLALRAGHDALRLRFVREEQGVWQQQVAAADDHPVLEVIDLKGEAHWEQALEREGTRLHKSLDIERGPLMRAGYFELQGEARLLLAIHHLAVDGVSWRVLLEELQQGYEQAVKGEVVSVPPNTPWSVWVERQLAYAQGEAVKAEADWWRAALAAAKPSLPVNTEAQPGVSRSVSIALDEAETRQLLQDVPRAYRTGVEDILLTALTQTVGEWSGHGGVLVALEGHGREALDTEELDPSRTVGWFTTQYPVWLEAVGDAGRAIVSVKERLRAIPGKGLHFGLLGSQLADLPRAQVGFNYLGQFDQSLAEGGRFGFARESGGEPVAKDLPADMVLDLNGMVARGRLSLRWSYREGELDMAQVQALAEQFGERLRALISLCATSAPGATASDFPLARLTQEQLVQMKLDLSGIEDVYPATPVQHGMLFHSLLQSDEGVYVNQKRLTLHGSLDRERLHAAWVASVARNPVLRTHFTWAHGGDALQVVHRTVNLPYEEVDWSLVDEKEYEGKIARWRREDITRGFDVERAPLLRITVFMRPDGGHDLVWTDHHALMDGWSASQLLGEVLRHYRGESLPEQGGHYRDYIGWLHRRDPEEGRTYWRERLSDVSEPTYLAGALSRSAEVAKDGYGELAAAIDAGVTARLAAFAQRQQVTVNTVVQAAWALLLHRYTRQPVVTFGATVAGRPGDLPGVEDLLGLFINTLAIAVHVPGGTRLGDWLRDIQSQAVASQEHAHTPLQEIQGLVGAGSLALFDSVVVFENYPVDSALNESRLQGLRFGGLDAHEETNYPLTLAVTQRATLELRYKFMREQFGPRAVAGIAAHMARLLVRMVKSADQCLGELELLDGAEQAKLLSWARNDEVYEDVRPVHERIAAQAHSTPDATAVVFGNEQVSYAQLEARSNGLAQHLVRLGVGPEVRVGIAAERSVEMVTGLLAILKAGGAYVPLDPDYPAERLAYMMEDSGIGLLLTQSHLMEKLPVPLGVETVELDT
ncbi:condensation domain-containing protein, partial [Paraburkholderia sp. BCC1885]|uniref:condensation domain-containing protein n=1 Tax=Paraburkholderia sp. BCC1885 TaxID=2562669 RepID=UPI00118369B8